MATPQLNEADKHILRLVKSKILCLPVGRAGVKQQIAGFCWHKGDDEMIVYLMGSADPVRPCELTILEEPQ